MSHSGLATVLLAVGALAQDGGTVDGGVLPTPPTPAMELIGRTNGRELVTQLYDDGRYARFGTDDKGPVHAWWPRFYKPEKAITVVYVHGFYDNGDTAFFGHHLATQFRDSGLNALFVVPEAPSWRTDEVVWKDLEELLSAVEQKAKVKRPTGPIWVVAHSGAYRTTVEWLKHESLERVILIDALYGADDDFHAWVNLTEGGLRHLTLVGFDTAQRTEWFLRKHADAVKLDDVPFLYDTFTPAQKNAKLLYLQSERFEHMELITSGKVMPLLLHALSK